MSPHTPTDLGLGVTRESLEIFCGKVWMVDHRSENFQAFMTGQPSE